MVTVFAPAKINLYLEVVGRRPDGYHLLDSLVVFADIGDRIELASADQLSLSLTGPFGEALAVEPDNLVLRAAQLLAEATARPPSVSIRLEKRLPLASGIGGGSADAAATLRGLGRLWKVELSPAQLASIALRLGADVPACLLSMPLRMEGIGELITPAAGLPPLGILLVNPQRPVPTGQVFRHPALKFSPARPFAPPVRDRDALVRFLLERRNDLEAPARDIEPAVGEALDELARLDGVLLARMSGSGATCFGLFASREAAAAGARSLCASRADWWLAAGRVLDEKDECLRVVD